MPKVNRKVQAGKFNDNVTRRGLVQPKVREGKAPVGPYVLGILLFVVVGSALFQIIRTASGGGY